MTIFLVLIRPVGQVTLVPIWYLGVNNKLGSYLGQNLYTLLVFSQRIPYAVYSLC